MIADCTSGKIDLVITKSISRFARNTLDTLKYVRLLKDKGVSVIFEDENINTMAMEGELLLTVLSSVAQQEVENISANVKKGLQMKMARGEMVRFMAGAGVEEPEQMKEFNWSGYHYDEERSTENKYVFIRTAVPGKLGK